MSIMKPGGGMTGNAGLIRVSALRPGWAFGKARGHRSAQRPGFSLPERSRREHKQNPGLSVGVLISGFSPGLLHQHDARDVVTLAPIHTDEVNSTRILIRDPAETMCSGIILAESDAIDFLTEHVI